jgi:hypothetical protein
MQGLRRPVRRLAPLWFALMIAGCSSQHATYVPDGRRGYVINCGGLLDSWSNCLVKAGRACASHGYETLRGNEEDRTILIACMVPGVGGAPPASP